ncbi:hypothetical protein H7X87_02285 [Acetobacteraceae bacterium]|nr:hypothetical protein [Candidatus Parcubacteria bacterium]
MRKLRQFFVALAALATMFGAISSASADRRMVRTVACDEKSQVLRFIELWDGKNAPEAMKRVNTEAHKSNACMHGVYFMVVDPVSQGEVTNLVGRWDIRRVVIYGQLMSENTVLTGGFVVQFTALLVTIFEES